MKVTSGTCISCLTVCEIDMTTCLCEDCTTVSQLESLSSAKYFALEAIHSDSLCPNIEV